MKLKRILIKRKEVLYHPLSPLHNPSHHPDSNWPNTWIISSFLKDKLDSSVPLKSYNALTIVQDIIVPVNGDDEGEFEKEEFVFVQGI